MKQSYIKINSKNLHKYYEDPDGNLYYHFDEEQKPNEYVLSDGYSELDLRAALLWPAQIIFVPGPAQSLININNY